MSASLLTVVLFFVYTWGLGFSLTRFVKESENSLERNIMRVGFGLSAFIVLGIALNALHIPLDWRIFLVAAMAVPLYVLIFKKGYAQLRVPKPSLKLTVTNIVLALVLVIFFCSLFIYVKGAFRYPYLEDDDPWGHAAAAKYVAFEKTVFDSPYLNFQYMDPYPPGYDMTFGILAQTSSSVYWVLKFFNALLISLSILFFFFFAKEFLGSRAKALFATFVLASVPAYLSHFIWAPVLAMAVFCQAMYAFEMVKHDKRWWIVAAVCFASILLSHPTHAAKLSAMIIIYIAVHAFAACFADKSSLIAKMPRLFLSAKTAVFTVSSSLKALVVGAGLSLFWWAFKLKPFSGLTSAAWASPEAVAAVKSSGNIFTKLFTLLTRMLYNSSGTATRAYSFQDFFAAQSQNLINNPIGFGVVACLLVFVGLICAVFAFFRFLPRARIFVPAVLVASFALTVLLLGMGSLQAVLALMIAAFALSLAAVAFGMAKGGLPLYLVISLGWLLFAFLGVNSKTFNLPIGLFAFRFWMILAIPFSIIAAEGVFALLNAIAFLKLDKVTTTAAKFVLIVLIVAGVLFTSTKQKYDVNTAQWGPGAFWTVVYNQQGQVVAHEIQTYLWLTTLPVGTKVFTFSYADQVIGFDMFDCGWCKPDYDIKQRFSNVSASELHDFLRGNGYGYIVIGGIETRHFGVNQTNRLINDIVASGLFTIANQGQAAIIFKAN